MDLATTLKIRRLCPTFDARCFPEAEREAIGEVGRFLKLLGDATSNFDECLDLYGYLLERREADPEPERPSRIGTRVTVPGDPPSEYDLDLDKWRSDFSSWRERTPPIEKWQMVALRSGTMDLFDYSKLINQLKEALEKAPTLKAQASDKLLLLGIDAFNEAFPKIGGVRHLAAHPHEIAASTENFRNHAYKKSMMFQHTVVYKNDDKRRPYYQGTYHGHLVGYELSEITLQTLWNVTQIIWEAFYGAESELSALSRATDD